MKLDFNISGVFVKLLHHKTFLHQNFLIPAKTDVEFAGSDPRSIFTSYIGIAYKNIYSKQIIDQPTMQQRLRQKAEVSNMAYTTCSY